jgi:hypothetical protein
MHFADNLVLPQTHACSLVRMSALEIHFVMCYSANI